jgi:hypothetical protein
MNILRQHEKKVIGQLVNGSRSTECSRTEATKLLTPYVGVLISLWLFLFAAKPKEVFLDGLKKLEQRNHKCVELRRNM